MSSRQKRYPANFPIVIRQGPEMLGATICNISLGGGCIMTDHPFKKGDTIVLDYTFGQTRAVVMWSMEKITGLRFENELTINGLHNIRDLRVSA
ncbi:PilZ domain-containing protein [Octadecabacter temperatus]|uniref:PilZ domain protein n=1 Tax=Octadecabacter temperatus TaxID=1458307 RepID=A0A0K0Y3Q8_9RHOB|nr:PilZ domain-containing protein [Octadecabacter temperatus]AKS45516.1 PilZ domain protein [Octadecabacter temperatus]SIN94680.1 PilZ domain-containing protein [Octadecabacter temperatus]